MCERFIRFFLDHGRTHRYRWAMGTFRHIELAELEGKGRKVGVVTDKEGPDLEHHLGFVEQRSE
jgi:hypothetical protein